MHTLPFSVARMQNIETDNYLPAVRVFGYNQILRRRACALALALALACFPEGGLDLATSRQGAI